MRAVKHAAAIRSARKEGGRLFLQVDPMTSREEETMKLVFAGTPGGRAEPRRLMDSRHEVVAVVTGR